MTEIYKIKGERKEITLNSKETERYNAYNAIPVLINVRNNGFGNILKQFKGKKMENLGEFIDGYFAINSKNNKNQKEIQEKLLIDGYDFSKGTRFAFVNPRILFLAYEKMYREWIELFTNDAINRSYYLKNVVFILNEIKDCKSFDEKSKKLKQIENKIKIVFISSGISRLRTLERTSVIVRERNTKIDAVSMSDDKFERFLVSVINGEEAFSDSVKKRASKIYVMHQIMRANYESEDSTMVKEALNDGYYNFCEELLEFIETVDMFPSIRSGEERIRKSIDYLFDDTDYEERKKEVIIERWRRKAFEKNNKNFTIDGIKTKDIASIVNKTLRKRAIRDIDVSKIVNAIGLNKNDLSVVDENKFRRYIIAVKENVKRDVTDLINPVLPRVISQNGTIDDIVRSFEEETLYINGVEEPSFKEKRQLRNNKKILGAINKTLDSQEKIKLIESILGNLKADLSTSDFDKLIKEISLGGNN